MMTHQTRISKKGELNVPKNVVAEEGWGPGTELEVLRTGDGIFIREKQPERERISWEEFRRRMPNHQGPPVLIEEMNRAVEAERATRWARKERNSR